MENQTIILDYYDGVTEGFIKNNETWRYFRILAWDTLQDWRLFINIEVDLSTFYELLVLLEKADPKPAEGVWSPAWKFKTSADETKASNIIKGFQEEAVNGCHFVYGTSFRSGDPIELHLTDANAEEIRLAIERTDDIEKWINR